MLLAGIGQQDSQLKAPTRVDNEGIKNKRILNFSLISDSEQNVAGYGF